MALDGIFINFLVNEISEKLIGSKVDKVHQPTKNELVLIMRSKQGMFKLFLTADANAPRFHLIENAQTNIYDINLYQNLLNPLYTQQYRTK